MRFFLENVGNLNLSNNEQVRYVIGMQLFERVFGEAGGNAHNPIHIGFGIPAAAQAQGAAAAQAAAGGAAAAQGQGAAAAQAAGQGAAGQGAAGQGAAPVGRGNLQELLPTNPDAPITVRAVRIYLDRCLVMTDINQNGNLGVIQRVLAGEGVTYHTWNAEFRPSFRINDANYNTNLLAEEAHAFIIWQRSIGRRDDSNGKSLTTPINRLNDFARWVIRNSQP